jgi:hypothetical protein
VVVSSRFIVDLRGQKRAEIAPGIGSSTDFFFIGANGFQTIRTEIFDEISSAYEELASLINQAAEQARQRVDISIPEMVFGFATPPSPQQDASAQTHDASDAKSSTDHS